jgi:hypothetical protein
MFDEPCIHQMWDFSGKPWTQLTGQKGQKGQKACEIRMKEKRAEHEETTYTQCKGMCDAEMRTVPCPKWMEVLTQANLPTSASMDQNPTKKKKKKSVQLVCCQSSQDTLSSASASASASRPQGDTFTYLYIFSVFPSSSGNSISGFVTGYVTGICKHDQKVQCGQQYNAKELHMCICMYVYMWVGGNMRMVYLKPKLKLKLFQLMNEPAVPKPSFMISRTHTWAYIMSERVKRIRIRMI